jgi:hypothetical protein
MKERFEQAAAFGLRGIELCFQAVAQRHQLIDLRDDATLFGRCRRRDFDLSMSAMLSRSDVDQDSQVNGCLSEFVSAGLGPEGTFTAINIGVRYSAFAVVETHPALPRHSDRLLTVSAPGI